MSRAKDRSLNLTRFASFSGQVCELFSENASLLFRHGAVLLRAPDCESAFQGCYR